MSMREITTKGRPLLQVALDLIDLERALKIALESSRAGVDIVEVGTPLIKSEGIRSIRIIRAALPEKPIVADMKIVDAGKLETGLAINAGADIVTVMGFSSMNTIKYVVDEAKSLGGKVMVDLMGIPNKLRRVEEILSVCRPDIFCIHIGIDEQRDKSVESLVEVIRDLKDNSGVEVAVAGGIDESTAPILAMAGADILIVGRAITTSIDIERKVKNLLKSIGRG